MSTQLNIQTDIILSDHTTFGIGGAARFFVEVRSLAEVQEAMHFIRKESLPFVVIGKGSNALFEDRGYSGLVILNKLQSIVWKNEVVEAGSGYAFSLLGIQSARKGLSGLEFAAGIPGSVGGAVFMNAGANKQEVCDTLLEVGFVDREGRYKRYAKHELLFSYRHSLFQKIQGCIVSATFGLRPMEEARKRQLEIIAYRTQTQPYGDKSAGCVFRNPIGKSAGALIEAAGLKGKRIGGACVSPMHANFIVNAGGASAEDVLQLVALVKKTVFEKTGEVLEMEVVQIPYE